MVLYLIILLTNQSFIIFFFQTDPETFMTKQCWPTSEFSLLKTCGHYNDEVDIVELIGIVQIGFNY